MLLNMLMGKTSRILLVLLRKRTVIISKFVLGGFKFQNLKSFQINFEFNALYSRNCICLTTVILHFLYILMVPFLEFLDKSKTKNL